MLVFVLPKTDLGLDTTGRWPRSHIRASLVLVLPCLLSFGLQNPWQTGPTASSSLWLFLKSTIRWFNLNSHTLVLQRFWSWFLRFSSMADFITKQCQQKLWPQCPSSPHAVGQTWRATAHGPSGGLKRPVWASTLPALRSHHWPWSQSGTGSSDCCCVQGTAKPGRPPTHTRYLCVWGWIHSWPLVLSWSHPQQSQPWRAFYVILVLYLHFNHFSF